MSRPAIVFHHALPRLLQTAAIVMTLSTTFAMTAPPTPGACNDSDLGERIKCKFGNVLSQQEETAGMLNQMSEIPDAQKTALENQKERNMRVLGRSDAADFKQLAKKKDPQCQVAEDPNGNGDHDGICKGNEDCLEVIGDQIGDDVQPCRRTGNPHDREVCVQMCDAEAVASEPDNFDESGRGNDLEEELDQATEQYEVLNQMLGQVVAMKASLPLSLTGVTACSAALPGRTNDTVMWASLIAKLAMETIADVSDKFCNQDVLGNNAATACAVVVILKAAAVDTWEVLDEIDGNKDSDVIDTSFECLKELNTSVGDGNAAIDSIEAKVDDLGQQVMSLQQKLDEVMVLLLTPPGRRSGYPKGN